MSVSTDKNKHDIPITVDFHDDYDNIIGGIFGPEETEGLALQIYKMLEHGYTFELAPTISVKKTDENGNIIDAELLGVSILTHTAKRQRLVEPETDVVIMDDFIGNHGEEHETEEDETEID